MIVTIKLLTPTNRDNEEPQSDLAKVAGSGKLIDQSQKQLDNRNVSVLFMRADL